MFIAGIDPSNVQFWFGALFGMAVLGLCLRFERWIANTLKERDLQSRIARKSGRVFGAVFGRSKAR